MKRKSCPECGSAKLYRSHTKTLSEKARKEMTPKRPFRCHECGWRGWIETSRPKKSELKHSEYFNPLFAVAVGVVALVIGLLLIFANPFQGGE